MEGWGEEGGYLLLCFFSIIYILGLVCYKHTIHALLSVWPFLGVSLGFLDHSNWSYCSTCMIKVHIMYSVPFQNGFR